MLLLAAEAGEAAGLLCTLLLIVAVVATALAILGLLFSLVNGSVTGAQPFATRNLYGAAVVAVIAWVLYVLLC